MKVDTEMNYDRAYFDVLLIFVAEAYFAPNTFQLFKGYK